MSKTTDVIFARIARRYDLINTLLSFGRDQHWRRSAIRHLPPGRLLDLGSGTGAAAPIFGERQVVALDPVPGMLGLSPITNRVAAVGERLPFADGSFDSVFSAYVFRNLTSVEETLAEIHRVLRPGGVAAVVDLGRPRNLLARWLCRIGTAITLPLAGLIARAPGRLLVSCTRASTSSLHQSVCSATDRWSWDRFGAWGCLGSFTEQCCARRSLRPCLTPKS